MPRPGAFARKMSASTSAQVMARKDALIKDFADYRAAATSERQVQVHPRHGAVCGCAHSRTEHRAKGSPPEHFVIATGSVLAPSPLPQLDELDCLNSDTALNLTRLPRSMIVLGGGAVALEFAQFFARFGVQVTLIQRSPHCAARVSMPMRPRRLEKVFRREGMTALHRDTKLLGCPTRWGRKGSRFRARRPNDPRAGRRNLFCAGAHAEHRRVWAWKKSACRSNTAAL